MVGKRHGGRTLMKLVDPIAVKRARLSEMERKQAKASARISALTEELRGEVELGHAQAGPS